MTCIVGIEHEGSVWLGGDSIAIEGLTACSITDPKVFVNRNVGFGYCGSMRAGQLIKYALQVPEHPVDRDDMGYLVIDLVDALREMWTVKGALKSENSVEDIDSQALIAYRGSLYYMDADMQIGRVTLGYYSIGCGADIALGALHVLKSVEMAPQDKVKLALEAAVVHSAGVRGPFTIIQIGESSVEKKSTNSRKKTKI